MPATLLLVLIPYLINANLFNFKTLIIALFAVSTHYLSFGQNSLLDTAMGYDVNDQNKSHHPLISGRIKLSTAHNVIHWGLCGLAIFGVLISLYYAVNQLFAVIFLFMFYVFGIAYNAGLSKESLFGFLPISICFTSLAAFGYMLSHVGFDYLGFLLLAYFFMTILFQISWSGHLKELEMKERSNILVRMGAKVEKGRFTPGYSAIYGVVIKLINVPVLGVLILAEGLDWTKILWLGIMIGLVCGYLLKLIAPRKYIRSKELRNMSIMEILTIYTPVPLVLPWQEASILMLIGVAYFLIMNRILWGTSYPRV